MVVYTCDRCKKTFNKKDRYNKHTNRKIRCEITTDDSKNNNIIDYFLKYYFFHSF